MSVSLRSVLRAMLRWLGRARARRRVRLAAVTRTDEHLMEVCRRANEAGEPYDSWRHALPFSPQRGTGM